MKSTVLPIVLTLAPLLGACGAGDPDVHVEPAWQVDFFDDFDSFNAENWQDQILWANNEDQCYLRDGELNTREVSDGTLKLRVINVGKPRPCDNVSKTGVFVTVPMTTPVRPGNVVEMNFPRTTTLAQEKGQYARIKSGEVMRVERKDMLKNAKIGVAIAFK